MSVMRSVANDVTRIQWDNVLAETQNEVALAQREAARARFQAHRNVGGEVLERQVNEGWKRATEFHPTADELLLIPAVAGG